MTSPRLRAAAPNAVSGPAALESTKSLLAAAGVAVVIGAVLLALSGVAPHRGLGSLLSGGFGSRRAIEATVIGAVPLVLMALGLSVAYTCRFWTIGSEGQFILGALAAAAVANEFATGPAVTTIAAELLAGAAVGASVGLVPGILRAKYEISEVVTSLLLNFIALFLLGYLVRQPLRAETSFQPRTASIPDKAVLPELFGTRIHIGVFLVIALMILTSYLLGVTPLGTRLRMLGLNPTTTEAMGVRTGRLTVFVAAYAGAAAGLAGAVHLAGPVRFVNVLFSPGSGFTAIVVALLGRLHFGGVAVAGVLISAMTVGGFRMQADHEISASLVTVLYSALILAVLAAQRRRSAG